MDIVEVTWEDSALTHGWQDGYVDTSHDIKHVGYVQEDSARGIALGFGLDTHPNSGARFSCTVFIPRSAIRKVTKLGPKRGK